MYIYVYISLSVSVYVYLYISLALYLRVCVLRRPRQRQPPPLLLLGRCQDICPSNLPTASSHEHKLAKHQAIPLADIVVGQGSAIVQLHTVRHQALQKSWNTGDVLYLCLDVVDGVGSLDLQRERKGLTRQMDEDADGSLLQHDCQGRPILDIIVGQRPVSLQHRAAEDQAQSGARVHVGDAWVVRRIGLDLLDTARHRQCQLELRARCHQEMQGALSRPRSRRLPVFLKHQGHRAQADSGNQRKQAQMREEDSYGYKIQLKAAAAARSPLPLPRALPEGRHPAEAPPSATI